MARPMEARGRFILSLIQKGLDNSTIMERTNANKEFRKRKPITKNVVAVMKTRAGSNFGFATVTANVSKTNPDLALGMRNKKFVALNTLPPKQRNMKRKAINKHFEALVYKLERQTSIAKRNWVRALCKV